MTNDPRRYAAQEIADHYGLESQISIAQEECAELIQALSKLRRVGLDGSNSPGVPYINARTHVAEEMADVQNLLYQLAHLLNCEDLMNFWLDQKLAKTRADMEGKDEN